MLVGVYAACTLGAARVVSERREAVIPGAADDRTVASPADLPGHEIVDAGLRDLAAGRETEAALLVAMAASRLRAAGVEVPLPVPPDAGHRLYERLAAADAANAHSRYNALIGRLASYARAAEHASAG